MNKYINNKNNKMCIFKCCFSIELIAFSYRKQFEHKIKTSNWIKKTLYMKEGNDWNEEIYYWSISQDKAFEQSHLINNNAYAKGKKQALYSKE